MREDPTKIGKDGVKTYAETLKEAMPIVWDHISHRNMKNTTRFNADVKRRLEYVPYKVGDKVMLKEVPKRCYSSLQKGIDYALSAKLQYRYCGPFEVIEVLNAVTFKIQRDRRRPKVVNYSRLKPAGRRTL